MSFTQDELHSFNTILEQRLSVQRQEIEVVLDQYLSAFREDIEQRLISAQQEIARNVTLKLTELQTGIDSILNQKLNTQQTRIAQMVNNGFEQGQQQHEGNLDRALAAQLLGIEQLMSQQLSQRQPVQPMLQLDELPQFEPIEVQTELTWEDLLDGIGKALDERLVVLNQSTQLALKNLEQFLSVRLHSIRDEVVRGRPQYQGNETLSVQEMLHGVEHLERIIESMQVAMTSNNALLSNRIYYHQQLPHDRAHLDNHLPGDFANNSGNIFSNNSTNSSSIPKDLDEEMQTQDEQIQEQ